MNVADPLPTAGSLLAATGKVQGLTLGRATVADVAATGVAVLDPFDSPSA